MDSIHEKYVRSNGEKGKTNRWNIRRHDRCSRYNKMIALAENNYITVITVI